MYQFALKLLYNRFIKNPMQELFFKQCIIRRSPLFNQVSETFLFNICLKVLCITELIPMSVKCFGT